MYLVVNKMMQLHHINVSYGGSLVEWLACSAIVQLGLQSRRDTHKKLIFGRHLFVLFQLNLSLAHKLIRLGCELTDILFGGTIKDRRNSFKAQHLRHPAEMSFQNLTDVHSARHAKRIQQYVQSCAIFEERHIFLGHNPGDNALVAVAPGHLVAD